VFHGSEPTTGSPETADTSSESSQRAMPLLWQPEGHRKHARQADAAPKHTGGTGTRDTKQYSHLGGGRNSQSVLASRYAKPWVPQRVFVFACSATRASILMMPGSASVW
jgi:hypothetical protein